MKAKKLFFLIVLLILVSMLGCKTKEKVTEEEEKVSAEDLTGIRISEWYRSEEYQRDIVDIMNFDDRERILNVTTLCFDQDSNILQSDDSYILNIPSNHQQSWIPECPEGTSSYTIDIKELN